MNEIEYLTKTKDIPKYKEYKYIKEEHGKTLGKNKIVLEHTCGRIIKIEQQRLFEKRRTESKCRCQMHHKEGTTFIDKCKSKNIKRWTSDLTTINGEYDKKHTFKHHCGYVRRCTLGKFLERPKCSQCHSLKRFKKTKYNTYDDFLNNNPKKTQIFTDWECVSFENTKQTTLKHKCGYVKQVNLFKFQGHCRICNPKSLGEYIIERFLKGNGINYETEYRFPGTNYRYDFLLKDTKIIIEYDGLQHSKKIDYFKIEYDVKQRDVLKQQNAENKGYTLYRIPHSANTYEKIFEHLKMIIPNLKWKFGYIPKNRLSKDETIQKIIQNEELPINIADTTFRKKYGMSTYVARKLIEIRKSIDDPTFKPEISIKRYNQLISKYPEILDNR